MKNWFTEILMILSYSTRTQWAMLLGMIGFVLIQFLGDYQADHLELSGNMTAIQEAIKETIINRYDSVAMGCLLSFYALAFSLYNKDKKKLNSFY